jgi:hypothetical protein
MSLPLTFLCMYKNINHFATCVTCQYIQSIDKNYFWMQRIMLQDSMMMSEDD